MFIPCFGHIYLTVPEKIFKVFLRAYAYNVSAHNVRAYEGKALRMCRIVL